MSADWPDEPPPLAPEPLARLREGLGLLLAYEHARDPDDEDGFSEAIYRLTDQLYTEGWHHYGYDQREGMELLERPHRIGRLDALGWVRLLIYAHRADYWTSGPSGKTFWASLVADGRLEAMDRRLLGIIGELESERR